MINKPEIKLENEDKPLVIETIQKIEYPIKIKQEYEENYELHIPDDEDFGEIEVLDEYIEEIKAMTSPKLKAEINSEETVLEAVSMPLEIVIKEEITSPPKINLRGVKLNLNKILGKKSRSRPKPALDPDSIEVPNCFNTSERPYQCKKCPLAFKLRRELTIHRSIHKKADFWCKKCGQKFRFQSNLLNHDCDFWCHICGKLISNKSNLRIHLNYVHGIGEAKFFTCDLCGNTYRSKRNIDTHMKNHMLSTPFYCAVCGKGFSHGSALKVHMWNHRDLVNCEICHRKFKPRSLYYHIKRCRLTTEDIVPIRKNYNKRPSVSTFVKYENANFKVIHPQLVYVLKMKN